MRRVSVQDHGGRCVTPASECAEFPTAVRMIKKMLVSSYQAVEKDIGQEGDMVVFVVDVNENEIAVYTMRVGLLMLNWTAAKASVEEKIPQI